MSGILAIAEHRDGVLRESTLEAAGAGLGLDPETSLVLLDSGTGLVEGLRGRVPTLDLLLSPEMAEYNPEAYLPPLEGLIRERSPRLVLMGHTSQGMDLGPALAGRLGAPLVTGCTGIEPGGTADRDPAGLRRQGGGAADP